MPEPNRPPLIRPKRWGLPARLLRVIQQAGGELSRNQLWAAAHGSIFADELDEAVEVLVARGQITTSKRKAPHANQPITFYRLTAKGMPSTRPVHLDLAERIVAVLRDAGGSMKRNELREAVDPNMRAAEFDRETAELVRRRLVRAENVETTWEHPKGWPIRTRATVYTLTKRAK